MFSQSQSEDFEERQQISALNSKEQSKQQKPILKFFDDPNNPWNNSDDFIKTAFTKDENEFVKFDKVQFPFENRTTPINYCTHIFQMGQEFYTCDECCHNSIFTTMCFCIECWKQQRHTNHHFKKQVNNFPGQSFCDCGRQERIKKQAFCENHGQRQIKVEYEQEDKNKFIDSFLVLYKIYFYLLNGKFEKQNKQSKERVLQKILEQISACFKKLVHNSAYYSRLVLDIWEKQVEVGSQKLKIIQFLSKKNQCEGLLFIMVGDLQCKYRLAKIWIQIQKSQHSEYQRGFQDVREQLFLGQSVFFKLAKDNYFLQNREDKYIKLARSSSQGVKLFIRYCGHILQKEQHRLIRMIASNFATDPDSNEREELLDFIFKKSIQFVNKSQETRSRQLSHLQYLANNIILKKVKGNIQLLSNHEELSKVIDLSVQEIQKYTEKCMKNGKQILFSQRSKKSLQMGLMVPFYMIRKNQNKKTMIQQFWKSIHSDKGNKLIQMLDISYQLIAFICHYQLSKFLKNFKTDDMEETQKNEKLRQQLFKNFLCQKKTITKEQIWDMKVEKQLDFKNAGTIFRECCKRNGEEQNYTYTSSEDNSNKLFRINYRHKLGNVRDIKQTNINYDTEIQIKDEFQIELFDLIFTTPEYFPKIKILWDNLLEDTGQNAAKQDRFKSFQIGRLFIIILILVDKFNNKKNKELNQQLTKIKESSEERFSFIYLSEQSNVNKLLCLDQENKQQESQKLIQLKEKEKKEKEETKKKGEEKKNKIREKFKKKQQLILERNLSKTSNQGQQQVDLCLLCHQAAKATRQLVYLSTINKDKTLCCSLYGPNNKANTLISTCFHTIHVDCFIKMQKQVVSFACPLCNKKGNCIFPVDFSPKEKKLNRICANVINATLMILYKVYDNDSNFILLFKHLLESKGLNSLMNYTRYEAEKVQRGRVDEFILDLLQQLYQNATEQERAGYDQNIEQLLKQVRTCQKVYAQIQQLLVKALKSKISLPVPEIDMQLFKEVKNNIKEEDFLTIKNQLQELTDQAIEIEKEDKMISNTEKVSVSFNIIRPPATSSQLKQFGQELCFTCKKQPKFFICLICGETICRSCNRDDGHKEKKHNGNWIFLLYDEAVMIIETKQDHQVLHLYLNQFYMPYEMRRKLDENELYLLDQSNLNKGIEKFLSTI